MTAACPRCRQPLEAAQVDAFAVRLCQACRGLLLAHHDLAEILDRSWHAISEKVAFETPFLATDALEREAALSCPGCGRAMEKYGYMNLTAVTIDRCDPCALMWLDADELQNMVLALAKTNYRSQAAAKTEWDRSFDIVAPGMSGAVPARPGAWMFADNTDDDAGDAALNTGLVVAQLLLRLFVV